MKQPTGVEGERVRRGNPTLLNPLPQRMRPLKLAEVLARAIVEAMLDDGVEPGDVLPSEVTMMANYGVARTTCARRCEYWKRRDWSWSNRAAVADR